MTPVQTIAYAITMPTGWRRLPPTLVDDSSDWIADWISESGLVGEASSRLRLSLQALVEAVRGQQRPDRVRWIFTADGSTGSIDAVFHIDIEHGKRVTAEQYLAEVQQAAKSGLSREGLRLWSHNAEIRELGGKKAVVVGEMLVADGEDLAGSVSERFQATVFLGFGDVLRAQLITQNMAVFANIADYGLMLVDSIEFNPEEPHRA